MRFAHYHSRMLSDAQLNIKTPENIAFGYRLADIGTRFQATVIDSLLIVLLQLIAIAIMLAAANLGELFEASGWFIGIFLMLMFVLYWGYYIVFELVWNGQTPGKRFIGLRVVDRNGVPVGLAASIIRNLVRIVDFFPIGYGLGVIVMFINKRGLRLGDMASGTLVIHDRNVTLDQLQTRPKANSAEFTPTDNLNLPLERLTEGDVALVEDFLGRRDALQTQKSLLRPILAHVYTRMDVELEDQLHVQVAINRLENIVAAKRSQA